MSIYHCSIKIIGRAKGRSAVASAAYRSGTKLHSEETNKTFNYSAKGGVLHSEVMLCENAPAEYADREILWNAVQAIEKNSNAQLAREIEVAIPKELSREQQICCVREYVQKNFVDKGMCADWALHDKGDGNPHAHIMLTTRPIKKDGSWGSKEKKSYKLDENGNKIPKIDPKTGEQKIEKKTGRKVWERQTVESTDWNDRSKAEEWRAAWADECNKYLEADKQVDHRSYERQGKDIIPTIHEGTTARDIEKSGGISDRCGINREIKKANNEIKKLEVHHGITRAFSDITAIRAEIQTYDTEQERSDQELEKRVEEATGRIASLINGLREKINRLFRRNNQVKSKKAPVSTPTSEMVESAPDNIIDLSPQFYKDVGGYIEPNTIYLKDHRVIVKNPIWVKLKVGSAEIELNCGRDIMEAQRMIKDHIHEYNKNRDIYYKPEKIKAQIQANEEKLKSLGFLQGKEKKVLKAEISELEGQLPGAEAKAREVYAWLKDNKSIGDVYKILQSPILETYVTKLQKSRTSARTDTSIESKSITRTNIHDTAR